MKLLLVQTGFLGDVVLSTPVIAALKQVFPEAAISVLTSPQGERLFAGCSREYPYLDKIFAYDKRGSQRGLRGLREMSLRLAEENFDAAFSLHKSWRTALLLWWTGIARRFGFREAHGRFLYTATAPRSDLLHEVERNLAILRTVGHEPHEFPANMFLGIAPEQLAEADQWLARLGQNSGHKTIVGLAPGSVWKTKRWSESGFVELAEALVKSGKSVVILGGPEEVEIGRTISRRYYSKGGDNESDKGLESLVLDLTGKISIVTSAAIISRCSVLVCNDSLPLHLGSAVGTPVVALFCSTVPEFGFGPWGVPSRVLGIPALSCRPCGRHGRAVCPLGTYDCVNMLNPQVVYEAVEELLMEESRKSPQLGQVV